MQKQFFNASNFPNNFRVTKQAAKFFNSYLAKLHNITSDNSKEYRLAVYLLMQSNNHNYKYEEEGGAFISKTWLEINFKSGKKLGSWLYQESQKEQSLFELVSEASKLEQKARVYKIRDTFLNIFIKKNTRTKDNNVFVDLFSLKAMPKRIKPKLFDANNNAIVSKRVRDAINCIVPLPFNLAMFNSYIEVQEQEVSATYSFILDAIDIFNNNDDLQLKKIWIDAIYNKFKALRRRRAILQHVRAARAYMTQDSDNTYQCHYQPFYNPKQTGRLYEAGAGFQGLQGTIKALLQYDMNTYNYDLKSAHLHIILLEVERYEKQLQSSNRIKVYYYQKFQERYLDKAYQAKVILRLGITKAEFKRAIYSYVYSGGTMNTTPIQALSKRAKYHFKQYVQVLKLFIDKLYSYILDDKAVTKAFRKVHTQYINKCECRLTLDRDTHAQKAKGRVLSHVIQGIEKLFIHTLILECKSNGIKIYSDEHDGILVSDIISETIINKVINKTSYSLQLINKPFDLSSNLNEYVYSFNYVKHLLPPVDIHSNNSMLSSVALYEEVH